MRSGFTIILCLLINLVAFSQLSGDLDNLKKLYPAAEKTARYSYARQYTNEVEFVFTRLFLFYKGFISSQDANSCMFTPSCSEYAILAIKKQGLVTGTINFFDRFSRCNGLSADTYTIDHDHNLCIDPPRNIRYHEIE